MSLPGVVVLPASIAAIGLAVAVAATGPAAGAPAELLTWPNLALAALSAGWLLLVRRKRPGG